MKAPPSPRSTFPVLVRLELFAARAEHGPMHSHHEGFAVILEEVEEYWDEVKLKRQSPAAMLHELVQVAAMAQRAAEDLELVWRADPTP